MGGGQVMKDKLKIFGAEALYLLAADIIAGLASLLQIVGRYQEQPQP